jgi:SAM-dependent methyltransferase
MTKMTKQLSDLLNAQAEWLAPARGRLLRRVGVAHRGRTLDLGAGYGAVTAELVRRCHGPVIALDRDLNSLCESPVPFAGAGRVAGDGRQLPFPRASFDLVFTQCVLMWIPDLGQVVAEIWRILQPGGVLIALEPDYGGLIEWPETTAVRDIWLAALARDGADPFTGRKLPHLLAEQGFNTRINLLDELQPPAAARFDFLQTLPLTAEEDARVTAVARQAARLTHEWEQTAHLPFFLITAEKPAQ